MNNRLESRKMRSWYAAALALSIGMMAPGLAMAQNVIRSVTGSQQANGEVIRVELSQPLASAPTGFVVQAPPRVAIDLPGVTNGLGTSSVEVNQGNVRSVNVANSGDRTRLVVSLKQATSYKTEIQGKTLLILLDSQASAGAAQDAVHFATNQNSEQLALRDIDFRRGPDGAGRVVVGLANTQVGVDLRQQGQNLVVEFLHSTLPESLRRKLDVSDFGTPVQGISAVQNGDRVRLLIEPRGAWEHSAYQTDTQFVLEVRPVRMDPNKLVQGPGFQGEKLSLNFQNIEVRALLQVIADFTNFNVVTSDTVTGSVTLRLKDVPWDHALDIILQAKGLGMRKSGNVLWIAPKEELAAKEQVDLEAKKKITELEPVRTQSYQLNYTKAEEIAKALTGQGSAAGAGSAASGSGANATRILSPRGSVLAEARTNQLFVSDIASKLEEVTTMISKIDIPVRQVLIEARIVEADDKFGRALGIKLGATDLRGVNGGVPGYSVGGSNYVTVGGNYNQVGYQTNQQGTDTAYSNSQFVSLPANTSAISTASAATMALSLFSASANRFLNLELSALEAEGKGKIVSSPRVITTDQGKAEVEQGVEIPYQIASSSGATAVSFKKASLRLEVTPQITPEGNVILALEVNKDSRGDNTTAGPAINTKHVKTQVLVENGGTVVIGGIFTQEERDEVNKVPLLGDIPYLGVLFRDTVRYNNKTELLMFITPKIITDRSAAR
ncbi:type IV pilus secretin PilQ [Ideonella azotifigens]|uniref:Type IV pilus biogenesis and competence protein PilQ n=1 Tax=Ideonella azotifigens TaxID=513160 RepID=A0ABN1K5L5_9BURK|nr:type IV pilus secretin PilQ [Ideonella azotifigens]MCD2342430.1 type IV pilus secretin PilQ [Ideonella azotifigens]